MNSSINDIIPLSPTRDNSIVLKLNGKGNYFPSDLPRGYNEIDKIIVNNALNTFKLSLITIFEVENDVKYLVVSNLLGIKFVIEVSETNASIKTSGNIKHIKLFKQNNTLVMNKNLGLEENDISNVLFVCGYEGLCVRCFENEEPITVIFGKDKDRDTFSLNQSTIAYPFITYKMLLEYQNINELYIDIMNKTINIQQNFKKQQRDNINNLVDNIDKLDKLKTNILDNFSLCKNIVDNLNDHNKHIINNINSIPMFQDIKNKNKKAEEYFMLIKSFTSLNDKVKDLLCEMELISENVENLIVKK